MAARRENVSVISPGRVVLFMGFPAGWKHIDVGVSHALPRQRALGLIIRRLATDVPNPRTEPAGIARPETEGGRPLVEPEPCPLGEIFPPAG